jgi:hypothetical protein
MAPAVTQALNIERRALGRLFLLTAFATAWTAGCQSTGTGLRKSRSIFKRDETPVRRVVCLYDNRPWLNLDTHGDRDVEGIRFRAFLDAGRGRGCLRDGTMHVEMYRIGRDAEGKTTRTLVSDWHYPTRDLPTIAQTGMLGDGYFLHLRWATKALSGSEVELIARFEDSQGRVARSETKRLRIPKYST